MRQADSGVRTFGGNVLALTSPSKTHNRQRAASRKQSFTYFLQIFGINADSWYNIERDLIAICPPEATIAAHHLRSIGSCTEYPLRFVYRHNSVAGG
jgi:hypothetical protein